MVNAPLTATERAHLERALELAERGRGAVSPNPLVGAVLAREGEVIGEGFHAALGDLHAERAAIEDCRRRGQQPAGATMYVTLEPCAHQGRQPPCTDAILDAGIARVVIASDDPSREGVRSRPGDPSRRWGRRHVRGRRGGDRRAAAQPAVPKARPHRPAARHSQDGDVARRPGRHGGRGFALDLGRAQQRAGAPLAGRVRRDRGRDRHRPADDPLLTARDPEAARQPTRVVFDSNAILPRIAAAANAGRIAGDRRRLAEGRAGAAGRAAAAGAEIAIGSGDTRGDRIESALGDLGRREITSLLLEGGPTLAGAFAEAGEVDEVRVFVAPVLIGGGAPWLRARDRRGSPTPRGRSRRCRDDRRGRPDPSATAGVVSVFTGLVGDVGRVEGSTTGDGVRLRIATSLAVEIAPGDSVAVNGVCLTATDASAEGFEAEVMNETLRVTSLGPPRVGRAGQPGAAAARCRSPWRSSRPGSRRRDGRGRIGRGGRLRETAADRARPGPRPLRRRARVDRPRRGQPHRCGGRGRLGRGLADPGDDRANQPWRGRGGAKAERGMRRGGEVRGAVGVTIRREERRLRMSSQQHTARDRRRARAGSRRSRRRSRRFAAAAWSSSATARTARTRATW